MRDERKTVPLFDKEESRSKNLPRLLIALATLCVALVVWNVYPHKSNEEYFLKFFAGASSDKIKTGQSVAKTTVKAEAAGPDKADAESPLSRKPSDTPADAKAGLPSKEPSPSADPTRPIAATCREVARVEAQLESGRSDPFQPVKGYKSFPRFGKSKPGNHGPDLPAPRQIADRNLLPPPPPGLPTADGLNEIPPDVAFPYGGLLTMQELPLPPEKPSLADKMKLLAVLGDRVILGFKNDRLRKDHKWPETIILGPGENFESVKVVAIKDDTVLLDEDGERTLKDLGPIM